MNRKGVKEAWIGLRKKSDFLFDKEGECAVFYIFEKVLSELEWTEGDSKVLTLPVQPSQLLIDECEEKCFRIVASSTSVKIRDTACKKSHRILCAGKTKM